MRRHGHARRPRRTLPALRPRRTGLKQLIGFRKQLQRLALQRRRQPRHADLHHRPVKLDLTCATQRLRLRPQNRVKSRAVQGGRAAQRQAQRKLALFGNALFAAHQPLRLELDLQRLTQRRGHKLRRDGQRQRQQRRAFKTVVSQLANRDFVWQRPMDFARLHPRRQRPLQRGGQARIARIFPVRVPLGLMRQLQAQPHRFAHAHAIGRMRQQLSLHLRRRHGRFQAILG